MGSRNVTRIFFLAIVFVIPIFIHAQSNFKGLLLNAKDKRPVGNVSISVGQYQVFSDTLGFFSIQISKDSQLIKFRSIRYQPVDYFFTIKKKSDTLYLTPIAQELSEVEIKTSKSKLNNTLASSNYFLFKGTELDKIPSLFGNSDVISALKTLPGIGKGGEGNGGLYIRGGSSGQNVVLFNDAIIYQPAHLLGIFSVFSSSFVDNVKIYKSGQPPQFRGRLSSVVDISSNTNVADSVSGNGSLGMIFSEASLDIPITENWSVSVGGRSSFMNLLLWPAHNKQEKGSRIGYDFYDLNLTSAFHSGKNKFFLSSYLGNDAFEIDIFNAALTNKMSWSNQAFSLIWDRQIDSNLKVRSSVSQSGYNFSFKVNQENSKIGVVSSLKDFKFSNILTAFYPDKTINAGVEFSNQRMTPNTPSLITQNLAFDFGPNKIFDVNDIALFLSSEFFLKKIAFTPNIRVSVSNVRNRLGEDPKFQTFLLIEPSILFRYNFNANFSLRMSANKNYQTTHLLPISSSSFPTDFWIPSSNLVKPQYVYQFSAGLFKDWNKLEVYVDFFYKDMQRLIEFNGGVGSLIENLNIEQNIIIGKGNVMGIELYARKKIGKLQTTLAYTLSKSTRIFSQINDGKQFPFRFDRPHDVNLTVNYQLNKKWKFSMLFTYASGNTYTAPVGRYIIENNVINEYGSFNGARMPDYHRLDVSSSYAFGGKKRIKSELIISVYNVYNRANPIFSYYDYSGNLSSSVSITQKELALLPIFPTLTYKISF